MTASQVFVQKRTGTAKGADINGTLERELSDLATTSPLPDAPDETRVEEWVLDAYRRSWRV